MLVRIKKRPTKKTNGESSEKKSRQKKHNEKTGNKQKTDRTNIEIESKKSGK